MAPIEEVAAAIERLVAGPQSKVPVAPRRRVVGRKAKRIPAKKRAHAKSAAKIGRKSKARASTAHGRGETARKGTGGARKSPAGRQRTRKRRR